jgi:hypothetical protein
VGRGRPVHARGRAAVTLPARTRTAGYPNQRAHPCAHQEHARTLTHSADRNDAPGLASLARTGFFKPVHMKSLSAHARCSEIIARKKTGGPASDLGESDPRFGGRVREHNPSIPVASSAQTPVIAPGCAEWVKSTRSTRSRGGSCTGEARQKVAVRAKGRMRQKRPFLNQWRLSDPSAEPADGHVGRGRLIRRSPTF